MQQMRQGERVGHIGRRGQHRMNELVTTVDRHVRLHSEVPLLALGGLMHLRVALALSVLGRTRCADDRRIDDRALADLDAVVRQIRVHPRQQLLAELVPLQQMTELADRRLIRSRLLAQIDAREPAHRFRVVQRLFTAGSDRLNQSCRK